MRGTLLNSLRFSHGRWLAGGLRGGAFSSRSVSASRALAQPAAIISWVSGLPLGATICQVEAGDDREVVGERLLQGSERSCRALPERSPRSSNRLHLITTPFSPGTALAAADSVLR